MRPGATGSGSPADPSSASTIWWSPAAQSPSSQTVIPLPAPVLPVAPITALGHDSTWPLASVAMSGPWAICGGVVPTSYFQVWSFTSPMAVAHVSGGAVTRSAWALPSHARAGCVAGTGPLPSDAVACAQVGLPPGAFVSGSQTSTVGPSAFVAATSLCPEGVAATDGSICSPDAFGVADLGVTGPAASAVPGARQMPRRMH